ncbi:MAG: hypothetical protein ACFFCM_03835, partial [Promethearchaeota archaeon]
GKIRIIIGFTVAAFAIFYPLSPIMQPLFQKIAVYSIIVWIVIQTTWVWKIVGPGPDFLSIKTLFNMIMNKVVSYHTSEHLTGKTTFDHSIISILDFERKLLIKLKYSNIRAYRFKHDKNLQQILSLVRLITQNI